MKRYKIIILNYFIIILFFGIQSQFAFAEDVILKTNFYVLDSLSGLVAKDICTYIQHKSIDTALISITPNPALWLVSNKIFSEQKNYKLQFIARDSNKTGNYPLFQFSIKFLYVKYSTLENIDSLQRDVHIGTSGNMTAKNGIIEALPDYNYTYSDKISRNDVDYVKSTQYDFANSQVPQAEKTFFEEVTEPVILVASAAITVLLLFTVRSK